MAAVLSLDDVNDLLKNCLLPELLNDLDSVPIENEHFKSYHKYLEIHLPLLYDWVEQQRKQEQWLLTTPGISDAKKIELQKNFIILLCELSNRNAIYASKKLELLENAQRLLNQYEILFIEVEKNIFQYYEEHLTKHKWKKNMGAVHGFLRYLKCRYKAPINWMEQSKILFALSVGLNMKSCHENYYKQLGMEIFDVILNQTNTDVIRSMNVHQVIYESVIKDIHILDSVEFIENVLVILIRCIDFHSDIDNLEWSYVDDIIEILIRNITLSSDITISICLLKYINKFLIYFTTNRQAFEDKLKNDLKHHDDVIELRALSEQNTSYCIYRWAKAILQMFVLETHKLKSTPSKSILMLMEMHKCYIICMLPIHLAIIKTHLMTFFDKFVILLMEAVKHHKEEIYFNLLHLCWILFIHNCLSVLKKLNYIHTKKHFKNFYNMKYLMMVLIKIRCNLFI